MKIPDYTFNRIGGADPKDVREVALALITLEPRQIWLIFDLIIKHGLALRYFIRAIMEFVRKWNHPGLATVNHNLVQSDRFDEGVAIAVALAAMKEYTIYNPYMTKVWSDVAASLTLGNETVTRSELDSYLAPAKTKAVAEYNKTSRSVRTQLNANLRVLTAYGMGMLLTIQETRPVIDESYDLTAAVANSTDDITIASIGTPYVANFSEPKRGSIVYLAQLGLVGKDKGGY